MSTATRSQRKLANYDSPRGEVQTIALIFHLGIRVRPLKEWRELWHRVSEYYYEWPVDSHGLYALRERLVEDCRTEGRIGRKPELMRSLVGIHDTMLCWVRQQLVSDFWRGYTDVQRTLGRIEYNPQHLLRGIFRLQLISPTIAHRQYRSSKSGLANGGWDEFTTSLRREERLLREREEMRYGQELAAAREASFQAAFEVHLQGLRPELLAAYRSIWEAAQVAASQQG